MTTPILPPNITNHGLFDSDYLQQCLESTLPRCPDLGGILDAVKALWREQQGRSGASEADEATFVRDVCQRLGIISNLPANEPAVLQVKNLAADFDSHPRAGDNYGRRIVAYLNRSGRAWGILTDGGHWRLYYRFDPPQLDTYFEVDLAAILRGRTVRYSSVPLLGFGPSLARKPLAAGLHRVFWIKCG